MATYEEEMLKKAKLESENNQQAQNAQAMNTSTAQKTQAGLMQTAPSANVLSAQQYLDALVKGENPNYQSSYAPQIKQLYDQLMNRGEFTYDVNRDPLYQQLRGEKINTGRLAMQDTIAQATGLSGGYGNSFAQAAGQQQYNQHMQQLTDYIPQLRNQARQEWAQEGDALQNQLAIAQQMDADEYEKFRTEVSDLWQNMQFDYQKEQDALAEQWNQKHYALQQQQLAQQAAYQQQQIALQKQQMAAQQAAQAWQQQMAEKEYASGLEYQQWQQQQAQNSAALAQRESAFDQALAMMQAGMTPSADLMGMAGITAEDVAAYQQMLKGSSGGGSYQPAKSQAQQEEADSGIGSVIKTGLATLIGNMASVGSNMPTTGSSTQQSDEELMAAIMKDPDKFKNYKMQ